VKKWTEGWVHLSMRGALRNAGFDLIAGEFPGGSDHELYPLNVTDPALARDGSPDPRRHSSGELIPDIVALKGRTLIVGEAKVHFDVPDRDKLMYLLTERKDHFKLAIEKFATERRRKDLMPVDTLHIIPVLIFTDVRKSPAPALGVSHLILSSDGTVRCDGPLKGYFN